MICILYGFPCEMDFSLFSPRVSESRPSRAATRVGFEDEWWEIHLTWKTIQHAFSRILYTLRHFNQAKYNVESCRLWKPCEMDLTTVLCMEESQKYARKFKLLPFPPLCTIVRLTLTMSDDRHRQDANRWPHVLWSSALPLEQDRWLSI